MATVRVLVVAGGGGCTSGVGGVNFQSGGAGGTVTEDMAHAIAVQAYSITVGAGGIAGGFGAGGADSGPGGSSIFDTITATGGTGTTTASRTGGSNANYTGGTDSAGTNSGGGAGGGGNGSVQNAGIAYTSNISGSSVDYALGGAGEHSNAPGTGTTTAGVANTGQGAGAGNGSQPGGSGVVIISYPTGSLTATGGTITTSGGNTIHTFNSNGTFTVTAIGGGKNRGYIIGAIAIFIALLPTALRYHSAMLFKRFIASLPDFRRVYQLGVQ